MPLAIHWRPAVGDPTVLGWIIALGYAAAAFVCFRAARRTPRNAQGSFPRLWAALGFLLILLGLNKQLDFQTLLTEVGRSMARAQGWFEWRRTVQKWFVVAVGLVTLLLMVLARRPLRSFAGHYPRAVAGLAFIGLYIATRLSSFEHIDELLGIDLGRIEWLWILEVAGIVALIGTATHPVGARRRDRPD